MHTRLVFFLPLLFACNGPTPSDTAIADGDRYAFDSRFSPGEDSVAYSGQVFRHVLIGDMKSWLGGLTEDLNAGYVPADGEVEDALLFYLEFDSDTSGAAPLLVSTEPSPAQATYDDVSSGKNLLGKIAGNDPTGQHEDWSTDLVGWEDPSVTTPESLVRLWVAQIDDQSLAWASGDIPTGPDGAPVSSVYVTPEGLDLRQLLQKFLHGAIAVSQGADDYLDDDIEGKGLLSENTDAEEGKPYTALEHAWDEGFGYFGAARTYSDWTDIEIASGHKDVDGDGSIDLMTEVCWGHSANAGKRDRDSAAASPTDFTTEAWQGFVGGRAVLARSDGELSAVERSELEGFRDQALDAWEKAIASTVVHYINQTLQHMESFDTDEYEFGSHAKAWSELKGFALAFQFNPRSALSDADFALLHGHIGQTPVLGTATAAERAGYRQSLLDARALLGSAYDFDAANLGDDDGNNGW